MTNSQGSSATSAVQLQIAPTLKGADAIVQSLLSYGVDTIFGLPGNHLYDFYDAVSRAGSAVRLITTRHEQGAAYMAFGFAQSTGKVGVYSVVPGPGLLNTTAALLVAYGCNARVLCVVGQIPSEGIGRGIGYTHELPEQLAAVRSITKWRASIGEPSEAPRLVLEAFRQLHTGRPRPVVLEMAIDVMAMERPVELLDPIRTV